MAPLTRWPGRKADGDGWECVWASPSVRDSARDSVLTAVQCPPPVPSVPEASGPPESNPPNVYWMLSARELTWGSWRTTKVQRTVSMLEGFSVWGECLILSLSLYGSLATRENLCQLLGTLRWADFQTPWHKPVNSSLFASFFIFKLSLIRFIMLERKA